MIRYNDLSGADKAKLAEGFCSLPLTDFGIMEILEFVNPGVAFRVVGSNFITKGDMVAVLVKFIVAIDNACKY